METAGMWSQPQATQAQDPGGGRKEPPAGASKEGSLLDSGLWASRTQKFHPAVLSHLACGYLWHPYLCAQEETWVFYMQWFWGGCGLLSLQLEHGAKALWSLP